MHRAHTAAEILDLGQARVDLGAQDRRQSQADRRENGDHHQDDDHGPAGKMP